MFKRLFQKLTMRGARKGAQEVARRMEARPAGAGDVDTESGRRRRKFDDRPGDEILYPTDTFTEDMQPRR